MLLALLYGVVFSLCIESLLRGFFRGFLLLTLFLKRLASIAKIDPLRYRRLVACCGAGLGHFLPVRVTEKLLNKAFFLGHVINLLVALSLGNKLFLRCALVTFLFINLEWGEYE